jgi:hypothetical protein
LDRGLSGCTRQPFFAFSSPVHKVELLVFFHNSS